MNSELEFSAERMREIGYRVVDRMVEHLTTLRDQPVGAKGDPATLLPSFQEPAPAQGTQFEIVLDQLEQQVLRYSMTMSWRVSSGFAHMSALGSASTKLQGSDKS